ncbi:hypothetical protein NMG60_11023503 [Bertholletia excelsa]
MEKEEKQQENQPSLLSHSHSNRNPNTPNNNPKDPLESSPRLKRDEWSEGAVSSLLEAYEAKWILRNRAKLKGRDWEDVARHVSSRANSTKSPKTQTQCKNKIESMKKRYRSESAATDASSWHLFPRLDLLLRGSGAPPPPPLTSVPPQPSLPLNPPIVLFPQPLPSPLPAQQQQQQPAAQPPPPPPPPQGIAPNSDDSNGNDQGEEAGGGEQMNEGLDRNGEDRVEVETDSSTPAAIYSDKGDNNNNKLKSKSSSVKRRRLEIKKRKRRETEWELGESIRWLGEAMVRTERARMETMKEVERMRAEADARRGEFDLKRTQIIANTQLEIARLFAAGVSKTLDSSLRIGRN